MRTVELMAREIKPAFRDRRKDRVVASPLVNRQSPTNKEDGMNV
jgi:hypothetical protein